MAAPKGKKTVRRRREKKHIEKGSAHIQSTFNNTIVTISDTNGNAVSWASAGSVSAVRVNQLPLPLSQLRRLPRKQLWTSV